MQGAMVRNVRINKRSMRTVKGDIGLGFLPRKCKPCGAELPDSVVVDRARLSDDSLAQVNAYRAKKGWDPIGPNQNGTVTTEPERTSST